MVAQTTPPNPPLSPLSFATSAATCLPPEMNSFRAQTVFLSGTAPLFARRVTGRITSSLARPAAPYVRGQPHTVRALDQVAHAAETYGKTSNSKSGFAPFPA